MKEEKEEKVKFALLVKKQILAEVKKRATLEGKSTSEYINNLLEKGLKEMAK